MSNDKNKPVLFINGKLATPQETQRILSVKAPPAKDDRATKPIQQASRPFSILRK